VKCDPPNTPRYYYCTNELHTSAMSNSSTPGQPPRSGLSLYANLLDPTGDASISRGPVVFKNAAADTAEENASRKHQIDAGKSVHLPSLVRFSYRLLIHYLFKQPLCGFNPRRDHSSLKSLKQRHRFQNLLPSPTTQVPPTPLFQRLIMQPDHQ
jgi:hypothetical protein